MADTTRAGAPTGSVSRARHARREEADRSLTARWEHCSETITRHDGWYTAWRQRPPCCLRETLVHVTHHADVMPQAHACPFLPKGRRSKLSITLLLTFNM